MDAISKNKLTEAIQFSNNLDALLWRNQNQTGKDSTMGKWYQSTLNTASLELQGNILIEKGAFEDALKLLKKAEKHEIDLGYGEPPLYARPVAYSIARMYEKGGKIDKSIEKYQDLLKRFPKSAMIYFELLKNYTTKGDSGKINEYEIKLKVAATYADSGMYKLEKIEIIDTNKVIKKKI